MAFLHDQCNGFSFRFRGRLCLLVFLLIFCRDRSTRMRKPEDWTDFEQHYQKKFHRQPPRGLDSWMEYAQQHQCLTHGRHYEALDYDMEFFRRQIQLNNKGRPLELDQVIPLGKQVTDHFLAFSLENHKLTLEDYHGGRTGFNEIVNWIYTVHLFRSLFEPVRRHKPPIKTKFIINLYDEPHPANVNATYPVFSFCKEHYHTDNKPIPPDIVNKSHSVHHSDTSVIQDGPKPAGFLATPDILIPARSSLTMDQLGLWFWPFYNRGPPFRARQNVLQWRGSTTGHWITGPRFHLVKQFGGTGVHRIGDTVVAADIAFSAEVQKPHEAKSIKDAYRFAAFMKYHEMQHMKYVVDVDGNGTISC